MSLESNLGQDSSDKILEITTPLPDHFSLVRKLISEKKFTEARKYFGPKSLGQIVFDFIIAGATCESYEVDLEGNKIICGKVAVGSVDYDVLGNGDIALVCSQSCSERAIAVIREDAIKQGHPTVIGFNGFGRA